jgi:hypothetical protein
MESIYTLHSSVKTNHEEYKRLGSDARILEKV